MHREEVVKFAETTATDGVTFHSITFQEVIASLVKQRAGHEDYVDYLVERCLWWRTNFGNASIG